MDLVFFVFGFFCFLVGIAVTVFFYWLVKRETRHFYLSQMGKKGKEVYQQQEERMQAAMVEALAMFKEGKPPVEIAKELLPKYPDVALRLGKRLGKNGLLDAGEELGD